MLTLNIFLSILLVCAQSGNSVILDRNQLKKWLSNYLTSNIFDLSSRQITFISNDTFNGLTHLVTLSLYDNKLTTLDANLFKGLHRLQSLRLDQNKISSLPSTIFDEMSQLVGLDLHNNLISQLDVNLFKMVTRLQIWICLTTC